MIGVCTKIKKAIKERLARISYYALGQLEPSMRLYDSDGRCRCYLCGDMVIGDRCSCGKRYEPGEAFLPLPEVEEAPLDE